MSKDVIITIEGWLGAEPQTYAAGDATVTRFRVGHTPRRFDRNTNDWVSGQTQWYSVSAWRLLGQHCQRSLHTGDPVIVHGRVTQRSFTTKLGVEVTALEIEALSVGHDLGMGVSVFNKTVGSVRVQQPVPEQRDEAAAGVRERVYPDPWLERDGVTTPEVPEPTAGEEAA